MIGFETASKSTSIALAVLALFASIIAIGGGALWVYDVNTRLLSLEKSANIGIGEATSKNSVLPEAGNGQKLDDDAAKKPNVIQSGRSALVKLCADIGQSIREKNSKDFSGSSIYLDAQFSNLDCKKVLSK